MKRRLKLTVTEIRRQTIGGKTINLRAFCPICGFETERLSLVESAVFLGIEDRMLEGLIVAGEVHAIQTASRNLRVCKNSLLR